MGWDWEQKRAGLAFEYFLNDSSMDWTGRVEPEGAGANASSCLEIPKSLQAPLGV